MTYGEPAGLPNVRALYRVLVVCTGNVHRSPLAERLLTQRLGSAGQLIQVSSAGTAARQGTPMAPQSAALLAEMGGDPTGAVAHRLTADLVRGSDLVLGAAAEHREAAVRLSPQWALRRAFTLRELARLLRLEDTTGVFGPPARAAALVEGAARRRGSGGGTADDDVADPQGAPLEVARACGLRVEEAVERIVRAILG
ncbi:protein-tyrosine phosphatase [Streptomyces sp. 846.5]|nr:low molecular weight phosphatase family protein [Streptomyces sp. 846.5]TDT94066.1 protein-tyrosine phosphatase [Streptomyces sp. 846.5]